MQVSQKSSLLFTLYSLLFTLYSLPCRRQCSNPTNPNNPYLRGQTLGKLLFALKLVPKGADPVNSRNSWIIALALALSLNIQNLTFYNCQRLLFFLFPLHFTKGELLFNSTLPKARFSHLPFTIYHFPCQRLFPLPKANLSSVKRLIVLFECALGTLCVRLFGR